MNKFTVEKGQALHFLRREGIVERAVIEAVDKLGYARAS